MFILPPCAIERLENYSREFRTLSLSFGRRGFETGATWKTVEGGSQEGFRASSWPRAAAAAANWRVYPLRSHERTVSSPTRVAATLAITTYYISVHRQEILCVIKLRLIEYYAGSGQSLTGDALCISKREVNAPLWELEALFRANMARGLAPWLLNATIVVFVIIAVPFWRQGTLLVIWKICGTPKLMIQNANKHIPRRNKYILENILLNIFKNYLKIIKYKIKIVINNNIIIIWLINNNN